MMSPTMLLAAVHAESDVPPLHENEVPMPHIAYGLVAMAFFLLLLGILWSFRNTAAKIGAPRASATGNSVEHRRQHGQDH